MFNYLLKYLLSLYFNKNKDLIISNKLPKLLYEYLDSIKTISGIGSNYARFYLINFLIYFVILLIYIIILVLI